MRPLLLLANIFINTFGITKPDPDAAQRAARFIGLLLAGVVVLVVAVGVALHFLFRAA